jgi:hypothetical protein
METVIHQKEIWDDLTPKNNDWGDLTPKNNDWGGLTPKKMIDVI